jgi:hypothetical protein
LGIAGLGAANLDAGRPVATETGSIGFSSKKSGMVFLSDTVIDQPFCQLSIV